MTSQVVELDGKAVDQVFRQRLHELTANFVIRDGKLYQIIGYHPHNGDEVSEYVPGIDNPMYAVVVAALRLEKALKEQDKRENS